VRHCRAALERWRSWIPAATFDIANTQLPLTLPLLFHPMRTKVAVLCSVVVSNLILTGPTLFAVRVPQTVPKALKETQDPAAVKAHELALAAEPKSEPAPAIPNDWIDQIRKLADENSKRESKPVENLEVILKKDGTLSRLLVTIAHDAKRTANDARQDHAVCRAAVEGKEHKLKLEANHKEEGPDLYEILSTDQLPTAAQELAAVQRLQLAFIKNGLNYTLQANAIVAPDGKSWAWEIGPSEEQSPNVIYGLYYYPITHEIHSIHLDNAKAAAKLEKAVKEAGMQLKWVKDMNDR
jgi:hypothetical protein